MNLAILVYILAGWSHTLRSHDTHISHGKIPPRWWENVFEIAMWPLIAFGVLVIMSAKRRA